jgi:hypothetical protein
VTASQVPVIDASKGVTFTCQVARAVWRIEGLGAWLAHVSFLIGRGHAGEVN